MRRLPLIFVLAALSLTMASPAPASLLCKANSAPCAADDVIENGTQLGGIAQVKFGTSLLCSVLPSGQVTDMGGEGKAVKATISSYGSPFVTGCTYEGFLKCPTTASNLPYDSQYQGSGGNGAMVLSDESAISIKVQCPGLTCTFSTTSEIEFAFTGGSPGAMAAENVPMTSGAGCPTTMSAVYSNFTPFFSQFLVGGPAPGPGIRLCQENVAACPEAKRQPIGTAIEGSIEGKSTFEFLYEGKLREPACEGGSMAGKTTESGKPLIGEVSAMSFSACGGGVCAVEAQGISLEAEIEKTTGGNGALTLATGGGGTPKIEINCGKAFICIYKLSGVSFTLTGGETPKLAVAQTLEKDAASEAECGSTMTWTAAYQLTKPTPLFVTS